MKIKIIKRNDDIEDTWYNDKIGQIFESDGIIKSFEPGTKSLHIINYHPMDGYSYFEGPYVVVGDYIELDDHIKYPDKLTSDDMTDEQCAKFSGQIFDILIENKLTIEAARDILQMVGYLIENSVVSK
jgi:hypothetical protein